MEFSYRGNLSQPETLWERVEQPPRNPGWLIAIRLADSGGKREQRFADRNTAYFNVLQVRGSNSSRFCQEKRVIAIHERCSSFGGSGIIAHHRGCDRISSNSVGAGDDHTRLDRAQPDRKSVVKGTSV